MTRSEKIAWGGGIVAVLIIIVLLLRKMAASSEAGVKVEVPAMPSLYLPDFDWNALFGTGSNPFGSQMGFSPAYCGCGCEEKRIAFDDAFFVGLGEVMTNEYRNMLTGAASQTLPFLKGAEIQYINTNRIRAFEARPF